MFHRKKVNNILRKARRIDKKYEIFGVSRHHYKLNCPVNKEFVHKVEEKYQFILPKDYAQFITEVGDGGAGPEYGIYPFGKILTKGKTPRIQKRYEEYRYSLGREFLPQPLLLKEYELELLEINFEFDKQCYKQNPQIYFIYENDTDLCDTDGFLELGTNGIWWFGLITCGKRYGQIFETDRGGIYRFVAYSFTEFYQNWLNGISNTQKFQKTLNFWKRTI